MPEELRRLAENMPYYKTNKRTLWSLLPNLTLPNERHLLNFLKTFPADAVILDIGSGGRLISQGIITFDKFVSENTKVIGDIHNLPFRDESVDCIICTGTLEHIENPWIASSEFKRVLKPCGRIYVAAPFMQGYHPDPVDFWRFTEEGLLNLFVDFEKIASGCIQGSGSGLLWGLVNFFRAFSDNRYMSELLGIAARYLFFWVKYFDMVFRNKKNNKLFASGYYYVGKKRN